MSTVGRRFRVIRCRCSVGFSIVVVVGSGRYGWCQSLVFESNNFIVHILRGRCR